MSLCDKHDYLMEDKECTCATKLPTADEIQKLVKDATSSLDQRKIAASAAYALNAAFRWADTPNGDLFNAVHNLLEHFAKTGVHAPKVKL